MPVEVQKWGQITQLLVKVPEDRPNAWRAEYLSSPFSNTRPSHTSSTAKRSSLYERRNLKKMCHQPWATPLSDKLWPPAYSLGKVIGTAHTAGMVIKTMWSTRIIPNIFVVGDIGNAAYASQDLGSVARLPFHNVGPRLPNLVRFCSSIYWAIWLVKPPQLYPERNEFNFKSPNFHTVRYGYSLLFFLFRSMGVPWSRKLEWRFEDR